MAGIHLRKYGTSATIDFEVYGITGVDLKTDWVPVVADCEIMKDGGAPTQCTNTAVDEGSTFSIVLTATEMQAARLVLKVVDAATKVILDKVIVVETYGHASAQHAFDLDTASTAQTGDAFARIGATGSGLTFLGSATNLATVDTVADGIQTDLGNATDGLSAIKGLIDTLSTNVAGLNNFDPVTETVDVGKISGSATAADNLEASTEVIVIGAATGTPSTTEMTTSMTEATDDHYNGRIIIWTSGALKDQATDITDYVGATKTLVYTATTEAPSADDTFVVI